MTKMNLKSVVREFVLFAVLLVVSVTMVLPSYGAKKHKEIKLVLSSFAPVGYPYLYDITKLFVDLVNQRGKGIVQINPYYGGTLLRGRQALPGLQAGTADIVFVVTGRAAGVLPVLGIWNIPVWDNMKNAAKALRYGSPAMEIINKQIAKKNFYMIPTGNAVEYIFTKKVVKTFDDLKGMKIRASGRSEGKAILALGAIPVVMPSADIPQSLQRNIIDGVLISPHSAPGRKIEDFVKSVLVYPIAYQGGGMLFAKDRWNKLPEDVRQILTEAGKEWGERSIGWQENTILSKAQIETKLIPFYQKAGVKVVYPTAEAVKKFKTALKPVGEWWVKQVGEDVGSKLLKYTDYIK